MNPTIDTTSEASDADLVQACRARDASAWEALVRRYQRLVYTVPRRAGLNEAEAADVFQSTFAKLVEHLHRLDDPSRVRAWLVTTARRESLHLIDKRLPLASLAPGDDDTDPHEELLARLPDPAPLPEELLEDLQIQDQLQQALAALDERSRRFLELLYLRDPPLAYAELAAQMGMAEGSIGPTRARCLEKLRRLMSKR